MCAGLALLGFTARAQSPSVIALQPLRHAVAAPRTGPVIVSFTQAISAASAPNLRVYGNQLRGNRPGTVGGGGTSSLSFSPAQSFAPGERVSVTVPASLQSTGGTAATRHVYQFTAATGGSGQGLFVDTTVVGPAASRDQLLGDLDNDGDLDLVTSGGLFGMYSYFNDGTGRFTPGANVVVGTPGGAALADFNQDGFLDLVAGDADNAAVSIAFNNGQGEFGQLALPSQTVLVSGRVSGLAVGDVDRDGDLDFVSANISNSTASVGFNDGTGRITTVSTLNVGIQPTAIQLGDIDNDGDLDLVTSDRGTATVSLRLNNGNGGFGGVGSENVGLNPADLVLADLDRDGDLDLVTANAGSADLSLRWNNGGSFNTAQTVALAAGSTPTALSAGDVDADGDLDLVVALGSGGRVTTLRNNGNNSFTALTPALQLAAPAGLTPTSLGVTLGDLDGDLDLDLVTTEGRSGRVVMGRNTMPPTLTAFSPGSGRPGDVLTLTGTNLTGTRRVRFGGSVGAEVSSGFTVNAAGTQLSGVVVPPGAGTGPLSVTTGGGTAQSSGSFVVNAAQLAVLQNGTPMPPLGPGYDFGSQATGSGSAPVAFTLHNPGAQPLTLSSVSLTGDFALNGAAPTTVPAGGSAQLTVRFQPGTTGPLTGSLVLTSNAAGYPNYVLPLRGTGVVPPPQITSITPGSAPISTTITISGSNLAGTTLVQFAGSSNNTVTAGFTINAAGTQISGVEVPLGAVTGPVTVTTPGGSSAGQPLTVLPPPPPVITSLSPDHGPANSPLTISGTGFLGATQLVADGRSFTNSFFRVVNATTITTTAPLGATGTIQVRTPAGLSNAATFRVTPYIYGVRPQVAAPGARIRIDGSGFTGATSVLLNGTPLAFTPGSSDLSLTLPASATTGLLTVVTPAGTSNAKLLTVAQPLLLSSISPASGPAGTVLTLHGTNLQGVNRITFTGPGQNTVTSGFTIDPTGTTISGVVVPPGAITGDVVVSSPIGSTLDWGNWGMNFTVTTPTVPAAPPWSKLLAFDGLGTVRATTTDAAGNVYIAGNYYSRLTFGSTVLLPSTNTTSTVHYGFVAKWSPAANDYVWALSVPSWGSIVNTIAVQGSSVYVGGLFNQNATFGSFSFQNRSGSEAFIAKITDQGTSARFTWVEVPNGTGNDAVTSLAVQGNSVYATGNAGDIFAATHSTTFGSTTLSGYRGDGFVAKLTDHGSTYSYAWVLPMGGGRQDSPRSLSLSGNRVYVAGSFYGSDFQAGNLTLSSAVDYVGNEYTDGFVLQLTDAGSTATANWGRVLSGLQTDYLCNVVAQGNDVYVSGQYQDQASFNGAILGNPQAGISSNAAVIKLDAAGNTVWTELLQQISAGSAMQTNGLAVSGTHVYVAFISSGLIKAGPNTINHPGPYCRVVKLQDEGPTSRVLWSQSAGGQPTMYSYTYTLHARGTNVYLGGQVADVSTFGPFTSFLTSINYYGFLAAITDIALPTKPSAAAAAVALYPNPARHQVTVQLPAPGAPARGQLTLLDALGRPVRRQPLTVPAAGLRQELSLAGLPAGVYVVHVVAGTLTASRRLVVE